MSMDMVVGRVTTNVTTYSPSLQELLKHIEPPKKTRVTTGCPYCDLNNYGDAYGDLKNYFDKELIIEEGFLTQLCMMYDSKRKEFGIAAFGEGEVATNISYCPKCGRKLVEE